MTQEEKARAYDEAIAKAQKELQSCGSKDCDAARQIYRFFPELAELEDERIRKWIIDDIRYNMNNEPLNNSEYKKKAEKALAWLEKQVEQKPVEWTEEDESKVEDIVYFLDTAKTHYASTEAIDDCIDWFKSIKQRMEGQQ